MDITSLDAFGKLTLESTIAVASQGSWRGHLASEQSLAPTRNVAVLNSKSDGESYNDYSTKLSDVFIDFSGELEDGLHSTTGATNNLDTTIVIEATVRHTSTMVQDLVDNTKRALQPL